MEKSDAAMRADEYEREIISLRNQLAAAQHRPDSGFGTDEDRAASQTKSKASNARLQASIVRTKIVNSLCKSEISANHCSH